MKHLLPSRCMFVWLALLAGGSFASTECSAWVTMSMLSKGEVTTMVSGDTREILLKVPPLGGREVKGNWHSCTLYYRGTQDTLQELIDGLSGVPDNDVTVLIDRSGEPGREEADLANKLRRSIIYQISVHVAKLPSAPKNLRIAVKVHACGGIDADKIRIPDASNKVQRVSRRIRKSSDPTRPTQVLMPNKIRWRVPRLELPVLK